MLLKIEFFYRSVACRFGVAQSTAWVCVRQGSRELNRRAPQFIVWPRVEAIAINQQEFFEMAGFPGVIGVVDGCNIPISAPH